MSASEPLRVTLFGNGDIVGARKAFVEHLAVIGVDASFAFLKGNSPSAILDARRELTELAHDGAVDVVHSFDTGPNFLVGHMMRSLPVPHMSTITGRGQLFSGKLSAATPVHRIYNLAMRSSLRSSAQIICQNTRDAKYFNGLNFGPPIEVIVGSGVDTEHYRVPTASERAEQRSRLDVELDQIVVTLPTRMLKSKGVVEFAEAAVLADRAQPGRYVFQLAGSAGTARNPRNVEMDALPAPGNLRILGNVDDMRSLYWATDVISLPTAYAEGLPRVLLEAASSGCSLVSTDAPGCEDVVDCAAVGAIIDIPVAAESLNDAIVGLPDAFTIQDRSARREIFVQKQLDTASTAEKYGQVYRRLAQHAPRA